MRHKLMVIGWKPFSIQFLTRLDNGAEVIYDWAGRLKSIRYSGCADIIHFDKNGMFEKVITHWGETFR